jgi:hypothetical protein
MPQATSFASVSGGFGSMLLATRNPSRGAAGEPTSVGDASLTSVADHYELPDVRGVLMR